VIFIDVISQQFSASFRARTRRMVAQNDKQSENINDIAFGRSNSFMTDFDVEAITVTSAVGEKVQITIEDKEQIAKGGWATVYRAKLVRPTVETIAIKQVRETKQYKVISITISN
jgi:hypothetical protein